MGGPRPHSGPGVAEKLPAGLILPAGGCEGSDDSQQGETPSNRGDAYSLPTTGSNGGLGGFVGEEGKIKTKGVVWVRYAEKGKEPVTLKLYGDPFEVCEQVRARMFPGVEILPVDKEFDAIMQKRKEDERRAK